MIDPAAARLQTSHERGRGAGKRAAEKQDIADFLHVFIRLRFRSRARQPARAVAYLNTTPENCCHVQRRSSRRSVAAWYQQVVAPDVPVTLRVPVSASAKDPHLCHSPKRHPAPAWRLRRSLPVRCGLNFQDVVPTRRGCGHAETAGWRAGGLPCIGVVLQIEICLRRLYVHQRSSGVRPLRTG